MVNVGEYNEMKVMREVEFGLYLDDGAEGILLPKRFVPQGAKAGDTIRVFVYHDSEDRLIATTQQPKGKKGDIVRLRAVGTTPQGAFLDNGLMKDLFVPRSKQLSNMLPGGEYLVMIYIDERTGRLAATEKIESFLTNDDLELKELDTVHLTVYRRTEIGYEVIINHRHKGMLHFNEIYRDINIGDSFDGFIKKIYADNKIDVVAGKRGYSRVEGEAKKIMDLLSENNGYLPYSDRSSPDEIYSFFGMSKKTFKMTIGKLYKEQLIILTKTGIKLISS